MDKLIQTLAEKKLTDVVIVDAEDPNMISAAKQEPVSAIVVHASIQDFVTVTIDGKGRKAA
ncbi:MAG: hypothetical protein M1830_001609, partial [Pleopsidium flavum]